MTNFFQTISIIRDHPQPLAFIFLKILGVNIAKRFFVIKRNGYNLSIENNDMSLSLFHKGRNMYRGFEILLEKLLKKGDNFIDVGGSIGFHSIYAKNIVKHGKVIMVEPMPELVKTASINFNLNKLDIKIIPAAISQDSKSVEMADLEGRSHIFNKDFESNSLKNDPTIIGEKKFSNEFENKLIIPSQTLDSITKEFDKISIIKIDTEGAELLTLKSGMNTFDKTTAFIVGLFNPYTTSRFGYEASDVAYLLIDKGFSNTYRVGESENISLMPLDITNEKFDSPDYYLFSKMHISI